MKRGYTRERYLEIIDKLKLARADIKISSDFIVGFPGETHDDFMETISLIEQVKFDRSFSFIYSKRPGTPAERLHDPIDLQEKKQRLQILQEHLSNFTNYYSSGLQDQILPVLVTGTSKTDHTRLSGRTACNRVVNFHADHVAVGKILPLRITEVKANSLVGEICVA
jgi:tRNA-2-methylthio-N6-dimethylallyladenosine synthase